MRDFFFEWNKIRVGVNRYYKSIFHDMFTFFKYITGKSWAFSSSIHSRKYFLQKFKKAWRNYKQLEIAQKLMKFFQTKFSSFKFPNDLFL